MADTLGRKKEDHAAAPLKLACLSSVTSLLAPRSFNIGSGFYDAQSAVLDEKSGVECRAPTPRAIRPPGGESEKTEVTVGGTWFLRPYQRT